MSTITRDKAIDISFFLLRVVVAVMFIQVGGLKLFGWFGGMPGGEALPPLLLTAGILEVVGGVAILFGLFTRLVAFILSGEMAVAYLIGHFHFPMAIWPIQNHGEPAVLLCFIFLFMSAYGAGKWSLDDWRKNRTMTS